MIDAIELYRIPLNFQSDLATNLARVKSVLYGVSKKALGLDADLMDFFSMIFAHSRERIYPSVRKKGSLLKQEQLDHLERVSLKLGITPGVLKLFFRIAHRDKSIDEKLNSDIHQLVSTLIQKQIPFPKDLIRLSFNLNALFFKTRNISTSNTA